MTICAVCKQDTETQRHHITSELLIDVCVRCHKLIHGHGVGQVHPVGNTRLRQIQQYKYILDNIAVLEPYLPCEEFEAYKKALQVATQNTEEYANL